ncbi:FecR domain-containing protein [Robiginitalea sp. M366]|uniref:FecR family protein n=1 Tax=Robiginitalea aestuariiviva TaxID=3036903 RepID=UPI00240DE422|nr:FecR domain-containing protein [Robiginitalea aestuariiviva]MDG1572139.1 FecR domain-containing protein [Robiginitalea aestuariiviva]
MKPTFLARWINGELSPEELDAFRKTPEYATYERIARASEQLRAPEFDVEAALERSRDARHDSKGKVIRLRPSALNRWMGVAAAVVLLFGAAYFYISSRPALVQTGIAQQSEVVLPDASEILLNAGSQVTYREENWDSSRKVRLEGEAFFKVAKGKTFTVETGIGEVTVLGTQFNVLQRDKIFMVRCFEGLVRVQAGENTVELPAGTAFRMVNGQVEPAAPVTDTTPEWTRNESAFRSMPLGFVLEEFQRQFQVEVNTRGLDLSQRFTGSFSNTNLKMALESIRAPLQLSADVNGNQILLYAAEAP